MTAPALHVVADDEAAFAVLSAGGDLIMRTVDEIALSRARMPAVLLPASTAHAALGLFLCELRWCRDDAGRERMRKCAAELAALVLRLATEGTPVWPDTLPGRKPDLRERAGT